MKTIFTILALATLTACSTSGTTEEVSTTDSTVVIVDTTTVTVDTVAVTVADSIAK